jgi:hypothetical protein
MNTDRIRTPLLLFAILLLSYASGAANPLIWSISGTLLNDSGVDVGSINGTFTADPTNGPSAVWDVDITATPTNGMPAFNFISGSIQASTTTAYTLPVTIFVFAYPSREPFSTAIKLILDYPLIVDGPNPIYTYYPSIDWPSFTSFYAPFTNPDVYLYISGSIAGTPAPPPPPPPPPDHVPDGGITVAMLGAALAGLGTLRRRFLK